MRAMQEYGDAWDDGLLGWMRTAQLPAEEHPRLITAVDKLLTAAGGSHRLGRTRWSKILCRKSLSEGA
jgi:hypothetical protein